MSEQHHALNRSLLRIVCKTEATGNLIADRLEELERENAKLREEAKLWEEKCHELITPHYILDPDLRASKFREALRFHPVIKSKPRAALDAKTKEAQP